MDYLESLIQQAMAQRHKASQTTELSVELANGNVSTLIAERFKQKSDPISKAIASSIKDKK